MKTGVTTSPPPNELRLSTVYADCAVGRRRRGLECGDLSPLFRRRLVAVELPRALEHASVSALARAVNAPFHNHASRSLTATSRLAKAVTSPRTPKSRAHPRTAPGVAQTSKSAVSRVSKPADGPIIRNVSTSGTRLDPSGPCRFGNRRYSRLGNLRYGGDARMRPHSRHRSFPPRPPIPIRVHPWLKEFRLHPEPPHP